VQIDDDNGDGEWQKAGRRSRRPETDKNAKQVTGKKGRRKMDETMEAVRCSDT